MDGIRARGRRVWFRWEALVRRGLRTAAPLWPYYLLVYAVGLLHLVEVHGLDPTATAAVQGLLGAAPTPYATLEAPLHRALETLWTPRWTAAATAYYLAGFVGLLAWTPALVAATGDRGRLTRVLLTYPILYALALPGYLLVPQPNPYVALGLTDPFSTISPGLEGVYYLFTTPDNTFPSLHVAYTAALSLHLARSRDDLLGPAAALHGVLLVASVVYLRVHWVGDVAGGLAVAGLGLVLADRAARRRGRLGVLVRRLDRLGRRGLARVLARARRRG